MVIAAAGAAAATVAALAGKLGGKDRGTQSSQEQAPNSDQVEQGAPAS